MTLEWTGAAVLISIIIGIIILINNYYEHKPKLKNHLELREEIAVLKGQLEAKKIEMESWIERGTRHSSSRDAAETRLKQLQDQFFKIISDPAEIEALKAILKERSCKDDKK